MTNFSFLPDGLCSSQFLNYTKEGFPFLNMFYLWSLQSKSDVASVSPAAPLSLSRLSINVRAENGCIGVPNGLPLAFETDWFKGVFSMRTKVKSVPDPYFSSKDRMFELQIQGQFKKPLATTTNLWFGGELETPMQLGMMKRVMASVLLKFVSSFGRGMHYSFGDKPEKNDKPHMVLPLLTGINQCIVTPPGERPPVLGQKIPDCTADEIFRRTAPSTGATFVVGPTYTLAFYSNYTDFELWESCNTGLPNMNLHSYWGNQKLSFIMYALDQKEVHHSVTKRQVICQFDLAHDDKSYVQN